MSFAPLRCFLPLGLVAFLWAGSPLHAESIEEGSIWVAERSGNPTELAVRLRPRRPEDWNRRNVLKPPETRSLGGRELDPREWWLVFLGPLLERWDGPTVRLPEGSSPRLPDLQAELRSARVAGERADSMLVDCVLRNVSGREIYIPVGSDAWSRARWEIELRDGSGAVRILKVDPETEMEATYGFVSPDSVAIAVGGEHVTRCEVPHKLFGGFPVHLRARFGADEADPEDRRFVWSGQTPNWSGMIWSDQITVER